MPRRLSQPNLEPAAGVSAGITPEAAAPVRSTIAALNELTKPRITRLVTITSGVGFTISAIGQSWNSTDLILRGLGCIFGTAFSAAGANALNQWWERDRDAIMPRTAHRPVPTGELTPGVALTLGLFCSCAGLTMLALVGLAPALVSLVTILVYVLVYTPLKPLTPLNTLVGAIPGALPPLIGWTAAATGTHLAGNGTGLNGLLQPGGWSLFLLMFVWQIPHFLAIAWMYRDDYAKGGYRMLPIGDVTGSATASTILVWSVALIPATIAPVMLTDGRLGLVSAVVAGGTGLIYLALCVRLARTRSVPHARAVFFFSIMHLPLLLMVMVGDAIVRAM